MEKSTSIVSSSVEKLETGGTSPPFLSARWLEKAVNVSLGLAGIAERSRRDCDF
jgi:hypothetical protein